MEVREISVPIESNRSVGSRINWGGVLGGALIAISMQFLLMLLGAAAGLSLGDRVDGGSLKTGAIVYLALTLFASLFVGGVVVSVLTGGESKEESILGGLVMWGTAFIGVLLLGAVGLGGGVGAFASTRTHEAGNWEAQARSAGVTQEQVDQWKAKAQDPATQQAAKDNATKVAWYGFFITWISMAFAALGGLVGAGPTFRLVAVRMTGHRPVPATA